MGEHDHASRGRPEVDVRRALPWVATAAGDAYAALMVSGDWHISVVTVGEAHQ